jgi:hypothetical protein
VTRRRFAAWEKSTVKLRVLGLLSVLLVAGCETMAPVPPPPAPPPPPPRAQITIQTPYHAEEFAWSTAVGTARLRGTTAPGRSCAGNAVALTPDTAYSRERIRALYGSIEAASIPVEQVRSRIIANDSPDMRRFIRVARCDANGVFDYENLPAGGFFAIAEVSDPGGPRVVMRHVAIRSGLLLVLPLTATIKP